MRRDARFLPDRDELPAGQVADLQRKLIEVDVGVRAQRLRPRSARARWATASVCCPTPLPPSCAQPITPPPSSLQAGEASAVSVLFYTHPVALRHDAGPGHPESPLRLKAILAAVEAAAIPGLERLEAPLATLEQVQRVHPARYTSRILAAVPSAGYARVDADTVLNPFSGEAALRAAGAACAAFMPPWPPRPGTHSAPCAHPGHHAEAMEAMGFCVFDTVAVGAVQARAVHGLSRLAILDFDVHHGNGTQAILLGRPRHALCLDPPVAALSGHGPS